LKKNIDKNKLGQRIFSIRNRLKYTLEQFGEIKGLNASKSIVLRWENGSSIPSRARLEMIAKIGNTTTNQLLYGSIDEFLENNIEELIKESDYPIDLTDNEISEKLKRELIDYILLRLSEYSGYQQDENLIDNVDTLCSKATSFISEYIYNDIVKLTELLSDYPKETREFIEKYLIERLNLPIERLNSPIDEKISDYNSFFSYLSCLNDDDISENYSTLKFLYNRMIEKIKSNGFYLEDRATLYITLSNVLENNVDLHTDNFIGFDFIFKENTFLQNKYGIDDYNIMVGLKIEKENSLYYLANYPRIEDVPLNTEAQYFILNHDNSYFISKITEKPDCKYLAPILGKME